MDIYRYASYSLRHSSQKCQNHDHPVLCHRSCRRLFGIHWLTFCAIDTVTQCGKPSYRYVCSGPRRTCRWRLRTELIGLAFSLSRIDLSTHILCHTCTGSVSGVSNPSMYPIHTVWCIEGKLVRSCWPSRRHSFVEGRLYLVMTAWQSLSVLSSRV